MNYAIISLGSNINPQENILKAKKILREKFQIINKSNFVFTKPREFLQQKDFLNGCILAKTELGFEEVNFELKEIEKGLGRIKTENKADPRTIDLDVVVWNSELRDEHVFEWDFLREAVKELLPELQKKLNKIPYWVKDL